MSVPTDKRDESDVLFKTIPQRIYNEMAERFAKMPGRYKDAYYTPILKYMLEVVDNVNYANILSVETDFEERHKLLHKARHYVALAAKLTDGALKTCNVRPKGRKYVPDGTKRDWFTSLEKEINLLGGVMDADRAKYQRYINAKG